VGENVSHVARARSINPAQAALVGLLVLGLAAPAASLPAAHSHAGAQPLDEEEDCLEAVPEESSVTGVTDNGNGVALDVHVLLDGVGHRAAAEVMSDAARPYEPLQIRVNTTFQKVKFPAQHSQPDVAGGEPRPASEEDYLFERSKEAVGGSRPPGTDVVYLLTTDRIAGPGIGVADCIGGIRYPERAFAMGEYDKESGGEPPVYVFGRSSAKIAAHELAHLLGAHHHYSNCAEGAPAAAEDRHLLMCTVMFPDVGGMNLRFSTLEAAVVRGHAIEFAQPAAATPRPTPSPSTTGP
jgi:hypothetical protein